MVVIFLGTIVYPISYEHARREAALRTPITVVKEIPAPTPVEQLPVTPIAATPTTPEPAVVETEVEPSSGEAFVRFERDLRKGDSGPDVKRLQEYLNTHGFIIAETGVGSPGRETELFGMNTMIALKKFQEANADILLAPYGLTQGTGFFGEATRALVNS